MRPPVDVPEGALVLPAPNLDTLTTSWAECLVLPPDPRIPKGTRLWHRRTPDGYLGVVVVRQRNLYQLQVTHRVLDATGAPMDGLPGRPPTVAELADALNELTAPGLVFLLPLVSGTKFAPAWPNPVLLVLNQVPGLQVPGAGPSIVQA